MANLSVCACIIPDGVETTSGVSSSVGPLTMMITNYLAPVLTEGSLTCCREDGPSALVGSVREFHMQLHVVFWSSGITSLVFRIIPMGFFPRTPSCTNLSFVNASDQLTRHTYLLHTLPVLVGTRGLTFVQSVRLPSTPSSNCLSSSVCNLLRHRPIDLPPLAYGARGSPLVYPANSIWSEPQP